MFPVGSRLAVVEAFAHLLGHTCGLQRIAQSCEWNVSGPYWVEATALFRRQANELFRAQALIAGRIRAMGEVAIPEESDLLLPHAEATFCKETVDPHDLACILTGGHRQIIASIRAALDVAFDVDDRASLFLLDVRLLAHERHIGHLAAFAR